MAKPRENLRLEPRPSELIDRTKGIEFQFDGRTVRAHQGDTVASALYASGTTTFSRGFKYHRRRGLLCVAGRCPNCLIDVDGVPNVRACTQPVRPGIQVRHQNAWPSLNYDFLSILDRLQWLMPVGFYYKALHRPKFFWRLAQRVIRRVGGLGTVKTDKIPETHYHHRYQHADVAVIGGGPAGLSAALEAAGHGASVTLVDDQPNLGGHLRFSPRNGHDIPGFREASAQDIAEQLARSVEASSNIQVLNGATAFACYQDNLLGVLHGDEVVQLRAKRVVLATGSYEVPLLFENNDRPGIMLTTAAQRLIRLYGIKPGRRAVVATNNDLGYFAALDLLDAGVEVAVVVDSRPELPEGLPAISALESRGIPVLASHAITRAEGKKKIRAVTISRVQKGESPGEPKRFACDLVCMSGGFQPANGLLYQAGGSSGYDEDQGQAVHLELPPGLSAAGEVTGIHDLAASLLQGRLAGLEAASSLDPATGSSAAQIDDLQRQVAAAENGHRNLAKSNVPVRDKENEKKTFLCICEDVTTKDIADAIAEGFDDLQMLKRYSTATMGPCQGKMCLKALVGLCAQGTGRSVGETGVTTSRPPLQPVPLGAMAGPGHMPIKRTPMDHQHRQLGAPMVELGPWQRPFDYGSPQAECLAVRQRVGIMDVSTLGKLEIRGRDAPALLDKLYTHHFSNLRVGRIRYGLLCSDNGTIMDDGTVTRLAQDRYFVTTTTGNVDLTEEWFRWWLAGTGMCAHVTNVTSAYAAINVAGPRARETLSKLTEVDISQSAFGYMRSAQGLVAGVPAILLRIGFVGETGWELHVPAEYGEYLWQTLMDAGSEFGISPFGLEAQRILRLEKKHIIVGQDTDAVSNPLESDMDWVVRFDKEDFIGRGGLKLVSDRGLRNKLVGFVMRDGQVPDDADPVVVGRKPVGRVTSARLSPTMGKGFGLAWIPVELAEEGSDISILVNGKTLPAQVTLQPFYDPEGEQLRS